MTARQTLRHRIYLILGFKSNKDKNAALFFSWTMTLLVLANVAAIILESVHSIDVQFQREFAVFDTLSILLFSIEYALRVWTAAEYKGSGLQTPMRRRWHYILSFHGLIDLIAILPYFMQSLIPGLDLRFLRVIRILRILKLSHYSTALEDLIAAIYAERNSFISALYLLALSILITSCLIYYAEHQLQPDHFGTIPDAMWWSIVTITTLGYGDAVPVSVYGKIIGAFTALSGVFSLAVLTGIVASAFTTRLRRQEIEFESELEDVLHDGRITAKEQRTIEHLQEAFDISDRHAKTIIRHIREKRGSYLSKHPH